LPSITSDRFLPVDEPQVTDLRRRSMRRSLLAVGLIVVFGACAATSVGALPLSQAVAPASTATTPVPAVNHAVPASSALPPIIVNVPKQDHAPWYEDVWKTLIGTFLGALLAFVSTVQHRRTQQRSANVAAGNMAMFQLRAMHRQTTELRLGVRADIKVSHTSWGRVPLWALLRPSVHKPDETIAVDFESLSFLTDTRTGQEALLQVRHAQELFQQTCQAFDFLQESAVAYQEKLQEAYESKEIFADGRMNWDKLEAHMGAHLVGNRESSFNALLRNIEVNPQITRKSYALLQDDLIRRFTSRVWELKIDPAPTSSRAEENLPDLPDYLATWVDLERQREERAITREGAPGQQVAK